MPPPLLAFVDFLGAGGTDVVFKSLAKPGLTTGRNRDSRLTRNVLSRGSPEESDPPGRDFNLAVHAGSLRPRSASLRVDSSHYAPVGDRGRSPAREFAVVQRRDTNLRHPSVRGSGFVVESAMRWTPRCPAVTAGLALPRQQRECLAVDLNSWHYLRQYQRHVTSGTLPPRVVDVVALEGARAVDVSVFQRMKRTPCEAHTLPLGRRYRNRPRVHSRLFWSRAGNGRRHQ